MAAGLCAPWSGRSVLTDVGEDDAAQGWHYRPELRCRSRPPELGFPLIFLCFRKGGELFGSLALA